MLIMLWYTICGSPLFLHFLLVNVSSSMCKYGSLPSIGDVQGSIANTADGAMLVILVLNDVQSEPVAILVRLFKPSCSKFTFPASLLCYGLL